MCGQITCVCGCGETPTPGRRFISGHNGASGKSAAERVYERIKVTPWGCWEFTGALNHGGYGIVQRGKRGEGTDRTHRVVYREAVGEIPGGRDWTIDHLCANPRCCNPAHLELVSRSENTRRQWRDGRADPSRSNREKTHCLRGHEFTQENTRYYNGHRCCRACARQWAAAKRKGSDTCKTTQQASPHQSRQPSQ